MFFWPDTIVSPGVRDLPKPDLALKDAWAKKITVLASKFRDKSLTMGLSAEAYELYADHSDCMLRRTLEDLGANIATKSFARKAAGKSIRLAALLALLADPEAVEIDERSMRSAVTIMEGYFVPQAKRIFDSAGRLSPQAEAVLVAAKAMAATNALPLAEAELKHKVDGQQQFRGSSGNDAFLKALAELEAKGMMRKLPSEKSTKGGRPSRGKWDINPALLA